MLLPGCHVRCAERELCSVSGRPRFDPVTLELVCSSCGLLKRSRDTFMDHRRAPRRHTSTRDLHEARVSADNVDASLRVDPFAHQPFSAEAHEPFINLIRGELAGSL